MWPAIDAGESSDRMNGMKKYVVSNIIRPEELTRENTTHLQGARRKKSTNSKHKKAKTSW